MQKLLLLNKKMLAVLILILSINTAFAQINFVTNPSFEMLYSCPDSYSQLDSVIGWSTPIGGGGGDPELFTVCCTQPSLCGVPSHSLNSGFQYPHSGNSYIGIDVVISNSPDNFREYIQSKLIEKLKNGSLYCVKFYVNLSDFQPAFIKSLGAYLDDGSVSAPSYHGLAAVTPQVYNSLISLSDTINWTKIEGSFVATGIEEYITIGNFFTDSNSGIGFFGPPPTNWESYYNIDDISVINVNLPAFAGNDTIIQPGDSVFIGRQPEIGLNEDCIWFVNGLPIDTIAGMWVKPDSTTMYVLMQTICGNVKWDTVTVTVDTITGMGNYRNNRSFYIYPNPALNVLNIECSVPNVIITVTDILGNVVIRQQVYNKAVSVDVSGLGKGLYFVKMVSENGFVVKRFLKE